MREQRIRKSSPASPAPKRASGDDGYESPGEVASKRSRVEETFKPVEIGHGQFHKIYDCTIDDVAHVRKEAYEKDAGSKKHKAKSLAEWIAMEHRSEDLCLIADMVGLLVAPITVTIADNLTELSDIAIYQIKCLPIVENTKLTAEQAKLHIDAGLILSKQQAELLHQKGYMVLTAQQAKFIRDAAGVKVFNIIGRLASVGMFLMFDPKPDNFMLHPVTGEVVMVDFGGERSASDFEGGSEFGANVSSLIKTWEFPLQTRTLVFQRLIKHLDDKAAQPNFLEQLTATLVDKAAKEKFIEKLTTTYEDKIRNSYELKRNKDHGKFPIRDALANTKKYSQEIRDCLQGHLNDALLQSIQQD